MDVNTNSGELEDASRPQRNHTTNILKMVLLVSLMCLFFDFSPPKPPDPWIFRLTPGSRRIEFASAMCDPDCTEIKGVRFKQRDARYLIGSIHVYAEEFSGKTELLLESILYNQNGTEIKRFDFKIHMEPINGQVIQLVFVTGDGYFPADMYYLRVYEKDNLYAEGGFELIN